MNLIDATKTLSLVPDTSIFKMHTHDTYEIFCFLSGKADYYIEGTIYELKPNDILLINKSEAHSLLIKSKSPYERYVVHFPAEALLNYNSELLEFLNNKPLGKNNIFPYSVFGKEKWLYYLEKMTSATNFKEQQIYLTVLFLELSKAYKKISEKKDLTKTNIIIDYINNNLTSQINLDDICQRLNFSKTHINRIFKQLTGSTIWEYIIIKRLLLAKELLKNGIPPTNVYSKCGFNDYCTFYRNYKQKFKTSPKNDYQKFK